MKKKIFSLLVALMATVAAQAQIISVVSPSGATSLYRTLPEAIRGAQNGSVVYLPGGGFTTDTVKITKKLTIIGVGHRANGDNVDGITTISGSLYFNQGSDGSAVMACYISGSVNIGYNGRVDDVMINRCFINQEIYVNSTCLGTIISQNICGGSIRFGSNTYPTSNANGGGTIKNNIIKKDVRCMSFGIISNNIFCTGVFTGFYYYLQYLGNVTVTGNYFYTASFNNYANLSTSGNAKADSRWGDNPITINGSVEDIFVNFKEFNFHFKDEYKQYESQVGIYAGEGFNDGQMAPVPYIMYKDVPDKTDAEGKLKVRIRVKANQ